jgi:hypothetical protein
LFLLYINTGSCALRGALLYHGRDYRRQKIFIEKRASYASKIQIGGCLRNLLIASTSVSTSYVYVTQLLSLAFDYPIYIQVMIPSSGC